MEKNNEPPMTEVQHMCMRKKILLFFSLQVMPNYPPSYSEATGGQVIPPTGHMYPPLPTQNAHPNNQPPVQIVNQVTCPVSRII